MTDHIWGSDQELSDKQVIAICRLYSGHGFSWQALMDGSMDCAVHLEECIESVIKYEKIHTIASRLVHGSFEVR